MELFQADLCLKQTLEFNKLSFYKFLSSWDIKENDLWFLNKGS